MVSALGKTKPKTTKKYGDMMVPERGKVSEPGYLRTDLKEKELAL